MLYYSKYRINTRRPLNKPKYEVGQVRKIDQGGEKEDIINQIGKKEVINMKLIDEFKDTIIEIYTNDTYEVFSVGYIIAEDDNDILVQLIHPMGFKDGKVLISKKDINKLKKHSSYLKELNILMEENKKENILNSYIFKNENFNINIDNKLPITDSILKEIMNNRLICLITSIYDKEETFGYIINIEDNLITMKYNDEVSVIKKDEIKSINIETITQKRDVLVDTKILMNRK